MSIKKSRKQLLVFLPKNDGKINIFNEIYTYLDTLYLGYY